jgi:hypothetical protein
MRSVRLVVPDLFLPREFAAEVCAGLRLPALEKMLARGASTGSAQTDVSGVPLERRLLELFGMPEDAGVATLGAAFDGLGEGHWLRADPVHLHIQRDRLLLQEVVPSADEAAGFSAALSRHFSSEGLEFFAPHPQRWYVRLDSAPAIETVPLSQVLGRNVRELLPQIGARWARLFGEIQMLLYSHEINERREARGELPVNGVWLWGEGRAAMPQRRYREASSDEMLVEMFAKAADVPFACWAEQWRGMTGEGEQLLVWNGLRRSLLCGDLAGWREALQTFEEGYAQPLWQALRSGRIEHLALEAGGAEGAQRVTVGRADTWALWRRARPLAAYPMV